MTYTALGTVVPLSSEKSNYNSRYKIRCIKSANERDMSATLIFGIVVFLEPGFTTHHSSYLSFSEEKLEICITGNFPRPLGLTKLNE
jgi:hypothetical protein